MYVDLNSLFFFRDLLLDESLNAELILDLITNKTDADFEEMSKSNYPEATAFRIMETVKQITGILIDLNDEFNTEIYRK